MVTLQEPFRTGLTHSPALHDCWCSICWSNSLPGGNKSPQQRKKDRNGENVSDKTAVHICAALLDN